MSCDIEETVLVNRFALKQNALDFLAAAYRDGYRAGKLDGRRYLDEASGMAVCETIVEASEVKVAVAPKKKKRWLW
jgi:hypothetical protein